MSLHSHLNKALIVFLVIFLSGVCVTNIVLNGEQQFIYLAQSFLAGKLHFISKPGSWWDTVPFNGHYYWPLGPFPSILLAPFILLTTTFNLSIGQGHLNTVLVFAIFFVIYRLALFLKYSKTDAAFWAYSFCFSTAFLAIALIPFSWWFAQVITVLLLFLALLEYFGHRRYLFIGILLACVLATRTTAAISILFFILHILFLSKDDQHQKIVNIGRLLAPVLISLLLLGWYNYARFGSFIEQGYSMQMLIEPLTKAREYGILSLRHIPANLYYFLFATPLPIYSDNVSHVLQFPYLKANSWGMSFLITSPIFIYLFIKKKWDLTGKYLLLVAVLIAVPIFLYYGIGYRQFGYRYAFDFYPFLFVLVMRNYRSISKSLTTNTKLLILGSSCVNFWLFLTFLSFWD